MKYKIKKKNIDSDGYCKYCRLFWNGECGMDINDGKTIEADDVSDGGRISYDGFSYCEHWYTKIYKINTNTMSLIQKMKLVLMGEPEKSLTKAGVIGEDGKLTEEGKELYQGWQFARDKKEFTEEIVKKILEEEKKENN